MIEGDNPFANGPKLHLYKRNRRLQTSSATRTGSQQGQNNENGHDDNPYLLNNKSELVIEHTIPTSDQKPRPHTTDPFAYCDHPVDSK